VLFLGVFYHLKNPMQTLEGIRKVCAGALILQTITTPHPISSYAGCAPQTPVDVSLRSRHLNEPSFPLLRFVEGGLDGDTSCWFVPSPEAVIAMLRSCGFRP